MKHMSRPYSILLLGAGGSAGINFLRALRLKKKDYYIVGVDPNRFYLELAPVDKKYYVPYAKTDLSRYKKTILSIIKKDKIQFVHAQPDEEVKIISDYRENLVPAKTLLPSKRGIDICQNKWLLYQCAREHNVPVPSTWQISNETALKRLLKTKTKTYWIRASSGAGGRASLKVKSFEEARMWIRYWTARGLSWNDFLLSELLPGKEVSWLSLWKNGKLICSQQKERYEWVQAHISPSGVGGTTAIQRTTSYSKVNDVTTRMVKAVDKSPNGIYVVDTKEDDKGIPCVMEINPGRFFTTSLFFATVGVNFPDIFVRLGLNLPIPNVSAYNSVTTGLFWIRVPDGGPVVMKTDRWTSKRV